MISAALMCLALTVYHEARGEEVVGQYAVAHVVMNRVEDERFPDNICDVVHEGYSKDHNLCQFSWYCDGQSDKPHEKKEWDTAIFVANNVMKDRIPDVTHGSLFYHADYVRPAWFKKLEHTVVIGQHIFYK